MPTIVRTARRVSLLVTALVSVVTGLLLVWAVMPDRVGHLRTEHLLGIVGLFILPAAALAALALDRRSARLRAELDRPTTIRGRIEPVNEPRPSQVA